MGRRRPTCASSPGCYRPCLKVLSSPSGRWFPFGRLREGLNANQSRGARGKIRNRTELQKLTSLATRSGRKNSGGMGSPKVAKSMVKQRICRRRFGALLSAALVAAVLAVVVFSDLFAQDPSGELSMVTELNDS